MQKVDYIIVGQGIAGTLLAWFLQKAKQSFLIIDDGHRQSSTKIAAGLINPITGRRFVKSWMIDDLLPFAKKTYQEIEQASGRAFFREVPIIRYFQTNVEGNNWLTKTTYEGYEEYLNESALLEDLQEVIHNTGGYGVVNGAKVAVKDLITYFRNYYLEKGQLMSASFDYQQLEVSSTGVQYQQYSAQKVLFCEGYSACRNPWFAHLPYESAKGEVLIVQIPNFTTQYIIKKNQFLIPLSNNQYWFGSNYEWDDLTNTPSASGKAYLIERLDKILKLDYTILDHLAGVRPVLKDRRPALGLHPENEAIGLLNGMGTKGTSIAPYWAKKFVDFLVNGTELEAEVAVNRFAL